MRGELRGEMPPSGARRQRTAHAAIGQRVRRSTLAASGGSPKGRLQSRSSNPQISRRDPDDRRWEAVHDHVTSHDVGIAGEVSHPQGVADHDWRSPACASSERFSSRPRVRGQPSKSKHPPLTTAALRTAADPSPCWRARSSWRRIRRGEKRTPH
jgi:hypothetical protein